MIELLDYEFMQRALIAAVFTGLAAPAIGTFLVQRRLALLGDGIGHVALTGVALGLLTNVAPVLTAVAVAVVGAVVIELLRMFGRTSGDVALAILFYGGLAGGVLLTDLAGESASALNSFLFGSITTVSDGDLKVVAILAVIVIALAVGLSPQLFAVCQDEEHAAGQRRARTRLQHPHRGARRRDDHGRDAHRRAAAGVGADGRAGRRVAAADPQLPDDACRGDGDRPVRRPRRRRGELRDRHAARSDDRAARPRGVRRGRTVRRSHETPAEPAPPSRFRTRRHLMVEAPRNTRQRRAVVAILEDLDGFASAQEIHDILKQRGESVGLSTVYRSLQVLADAAEVDALRNDDGEVLYRQCSAGHHHHLVCRSCGRTVEVEGPTVERWADKIAEENGFQDVAHTLEIFGTCNTCVSARG